MATEARYVPAGGFRSLTRFYDRTIALTTRERTFRGRLRGQALAGLPDGARVVDVGCGTGTFAIALAAAAPAAEVVGLDGDPEILALARAKPGAERVDLREGLATELPLPDASADRVVMSLLLHHLARDAKERALAEAARVLRPGGRLHVADWGRPRDPLMRGAFFTLQLIDGFDGTRDHAAGRLPELIAAAGLRDVRCHDRLRTAWGSLELLSALRP